MPQILYLLCVILPNIELQCSDNNAFFLFHPLVLQFIRCQKSIGGLLFTRYNGSSEFTQSKPHVSSLDANRADSEKKQRTQSKQRARFYKDDCNFESLEGILSKRHQRKLQIPKPQSRMDERLAPADAWRLGGGGRGWRPPSSSAAAAEAEADKYLPDDDDDGDGDEDKDPR